MSTNHSTALRVIHKFDLEVTDWQTIPIKAGGVVLALQVQHGSPELWVLVDPQVAEIEQRSFRMVGTGVEFVYAPCLCYVATFQMQNGGLVFHLFEDTTP